MLTHILVHYHSVDLSSACSHWADSWLSVQLPGRGWTCKSVLSPVAFLWDLLDCAIFFLLSCLICSATGFFNVHHLSSSPFTFWKISCCFLTSLLSVCFALPPPCPSVSHWLAHKTATLSPAIISCLYFLYAAYCCTLKMEAVCSFKTVNLYQTMWCHTSEHGNLYILLFRHTLLWEHAIWKWKWLFETGALILESQYVWSNTGIWILESS